MVPIKRTLHLHCKCVKTEAPDKDAAVQSRQETHLSACSSVFARLSLVIMFQTAVRGRINSDCHYLRARGTCSRRSCLLRRRLLKR